MSQAPSAPADWSSLFTEQRLEVKVTAVWCLRGAGVILAGLGGRVQSYRREAGGRRRWSEAASVRVFKGAVVHGFVVEEEEAQGDLLRVLVFGGKKYAVVGVDPSTGCLRALSEAEACSDWVLHAKWEREASGSLLFITAHNRILRRSLAEPRTEVSYSCQEKCILYGAKMLDEVVLGGTVFQEVIIWSLPEAGEEEAPSSESRVLHRLRGHDGVIFSLDFCPRSSVICSTSDDRTARIWKVDFGSPRDWASAKIQCTRTLRGHAARVFRCRNGLFGGGSGLVSGGEDSLINVWEELDSAPVPRKAHGGSPVWSIDVDEASDTVVSGGGDGALRVWALRGGGVEVARLSGLDLGEGDAPKVVRLLSGSTVCVLTNCGKVLLHDADNASSKCVLEDDRLRSYGLLEVASSGRVLVLANLAGELLVLDLEGEVASVERRRLFDGKVFSLHVLGDGERFLCCGAHGRLALSFVQASDEELTLQLPKTGDQRWVSCAALLEDRARLLVGDRNGAIHLFDLASENPAPLASLLKLHGRHGIGDLREVRRDVFETSGRDGQTKLVHFIEGHLRECKASKLPMTWLERFFAFGDSNLLLGFHSSEFVVYDLGEQRSLAEIPCGGSHRSWKGFPN